MHGATLAASTSALPSRQFRQNALNRNAHKMGPAMDTISGNDVVLLPHRGFHSHSNSFLTRVQVAEAPDNLLFVEITGWRFQTTNYLHLAIHKEGFVALNGDSRWGSIVEIMRLEWLRGDKREEKTINLMCTNHQFVLNTRRKFLCDGNRSARHIIFLIRYGESILNSNRFCDVNFLLKDFRKDKFLLMN